MKMVQAVVRPAKIDELTQAVMKLGLSGLTVTEVKGLGRQRGQPIIYQLAEYQSELIPKLMVEVVVSGEQVEEIIGSLVETLRTGCHGDGKIFISTLEEVVQIRTGQRGLDTL